MSGSTVVVVTSCVLMVEHPGAETAVETVTSVTSATVSDTAVGPGGTALSRYGVSTGVGVHVHVTSVAKAGSVLFAVPVGVTVTIGVVVRGTGVARGCSYGTHPTTVMSVPG